MDPSHDAHRYLTPAGDALHLLEILPAQKIQKVVAARTQTRLELQTQ